MKAAVMEKTTAIDPSTVFWRQLDIIKMEALNNAAITIIGVGSVGSFTAMSLAKMGITKFILNDNDFVETHNLPNQFFEIADIGKHKVEAVEEHITRMTGVVPFLDIERFKDQKLKGIVISAVDSMESRKLIWEKVKLNPAVDLYIDGRMGAEVMHIFAIQPCDMDHITLYERNLFDDSEASPEKCTAKSIIYNVLGIASFICSNVKKHLMGQPVPKEIIFDYTTMYMGTTK